MTVLCLVRRTPKAFIEIVRLEKKRSTLDRVPRGRSTRGAFSKVGCVLDWLEQKAAWSGLANIAMIEETREIKGCISIERRFFISSLPANARQIAQAVRAHWAIENTLHWTFDVVFNEDNSTVRKDHAPQNMAIVRHVVLNILNTVKKQFKGIGVKALRKKAGWGNDNLRLILKQSF